MGKFLSEYFIALDEDFKNVGTRFPGILFSISSVVAMNLTYSNSILTMVHWKKCNYQI